MGCCVCIALMPTYFFHKSLSGSSFSEIFEFFFNSLFSTLRMDLLQLLCCVCGIAFIIKEVAKNLSTSAAILISVVLINIVPFAPILFDYFFRSLSFPVTMIRVYFFTTAHLLTIALLFWKKGLEAALCCEVVVVIILQLIVPVIIFLLSA